MSGALVVARPALREDLAVGQHHRVHLYAARGHSAQRVARRCRGEVDDVGRGGRWTSSSEIHHAWHVDGRQKRKQN